MAGALGLVQVLSADEVLQEEADRRASAIPDISEDLMDNLAGHVLGHWELAKKAKTKILPRLRAAQKARHGEYEADKLAQIREFGGSEEYARITANKCRVVEAWLRDVFLGQTSRPWTLAPTPNPNFPPGVKDDVMKVVSADVAQLFAQTGQMPDPSTVRARQAALLEMAEEQLREEARKATQRMERLIEDQLSEGGFAQALVEFLADFVVFPAAIMKGPVLRRKSKITWGHSDTGETIPVVSSEIVPEFERVDPFRAYPAPGATTPQDGFFIEHVTFEYQDLHDLIGVDGFDEDAIRAALAEDNLGNWLGLSDSDVASVDDQPLSDIRRVFSYEGLEYHGAVKGSDLIDWGLEADIEDEDKMYEACIWLVGKWVIKAQLNYDPLGIRPYHKTAYEELPGEFWGMSIPDILEDMQGVANAALRSLVNNMAMASGPQVGVNIDRLAPGQEVSTLTPWNVWQLIDKDFGGSDGRSPIEFFQPQSNAQELLAILEKMYQFSDDFSLVPRYMAGSDRVGGAGRTASGLSMLMDAANKGLKGVVANIDQRVLAPLLEKLYAHNMMYHDDETVKGDAQVIARGAVSLMQLESLQLRRNEFLNVTANPMDMEIVGLEGRAEVLREVAKGLEMDTNKIVPQREQLVQRQQAQMTAQQPPAGAPQVGAGEQLANGAAVTDNFSNSSMV